MQGMVPFLDVTRDTGGLQLVPRSHREEVQEQIREENDAKHSSSDFVKVSDEKYLAEAMVVEAKAGDLILWDSRVIHGSKVGPAVLEAGEGLARCTGLVCMTPRTKASPEVLHTRQLGFQSAIGFTHWPHEAKFGALPDSDGRNISWKLEKHQLLQLNQEQKKVL